jgi:hypothetical protein
MYLGSGGCCPNIRGSIRFGRADAARQPGSSRLGRADAAAAAGVAKQMLPGFIWISRRLHLDLVF